MEKKILYWKNGWKRSKKNIARGVDELACLVSIWVLKFIQNLVNLCFR